jgi:pyruvate formate lyase activating enzyme
MQHPPRSPQTMVQGTMNSTDLDQARTGRILHLQRLSTEDGPGIRTTVFFKGCPLQCAWCHNPESISPYPQVQWLETRCIGCGTCQAACPNGCLARDEAGVTIDRACCAGCGTCAQACPANALELLGTAVGADELARELAKDRTYFQTSGGGVTASGGEPLLQPDFVADLFARLRADGIHTALDTCGLASRQSLLKVLPHVDLVLFDLKEIDTARHRALTGQGNEVILEALRFISSYITKQATQTRLWIRTPLIPQATASRENLAGIGAHLARNVDGLVERWELCAFNNLCRDKYRRLDMDWPFGDTPLLSAEELHRFQEYARDSGVDPDIVIATGATRPA